MSMLSVGRCQANIVWERRFFPRALIALVNGSFVLHSKDLRRGKILGRFVTDRSLALPRSSIDLSCQISEGHVNLFPIRPPLAGQGIENNAFLRRRKERE